jgi:hypothetical protein
LNLERSLLKAVEQSTYGLQHQIEELRRAFNKADQSDINSFASASQDKNAKLLDRVGDRVNGLLPHMARERFLKTLYFDIIDDRYDSIPEAHERTLRWVLESGSHQGVAWHNYPSWLMSSNSANNIYWITGKPGSGKSTLMRYLADSPKMHSILSRWGARKPVRVLKCFFWNPGKTIQKSMEGLLRTLAHQALDDDSIDDTVIRGLSPDHWHSCLYDRKPRKWSVPELLSLFRLIVITLSKHSNVALFVDGLDEFGVNREEREELVNLFLEMWDTPNVKMCLSSRPWNEFKDTLGSFPSLRLENLTRQDMRDFVEDHLGNSRAIRDLATIAPDEVNDLREQLVMKSDGVFLWLHLVTRRLRTAAQDGKSLRKLFEILNEIPPDLDDFFQHMLRRIPDADRIQTSKIFQIVIGGHSESLPTLMTLSFTDEDKEDFALTEEINNETRLQILSRIVAFKRRLDSQCMDLLISAPDRNTPGYGWENTQIEYLHRAVKDFLESDVSRELLLSYTRGPINTTRYLCNAFVAQMIFMKKFITQWPSSEKQQRGAHAYFFEEAMKSLNSLPTSLNTPAKPFFESAVDQIDPLLKVESLSINMKGFHEHSSDDPFSRTTHKICMVYQQNRHSATHEYLLMAVVCGWDSFARSYLEQLPSESDMTPYLNASVTRPTETLEQFDLDILGRLLRRTENIRNAAWATTLIQNYHLMVTNLLRTSAAARDKGRLAEFTRLIIAKTVGMFGSEVQLLAFTREADSGVRSIYGGATRGKLLRFIQQTRKTWKVTANPPPARASTQPEAPPIRPSLQARPAPHPLQYSASPPLPRPPAAHNSTQLPAAQAPPELAATQHQPHPSARLLKHGILSRRVKAIFSLDRTHMI